MKKKITKFSAAFLAVILVFNLYAQPKAQAALTEAAATTFLAEIATVAANGAGLITTGATATTELTTVTAAAVTEYAAATGTTATALAGTTAGAATVGSGGTILILAAGAAIIAGIIAFIANKYNVEEINASEPMEELTTFAGIKLSKARYVTSQFGNYYEVTETGSEIVKTTTDNGTITYYIMGEEVTPTTNTYNQPIITKAWPVPENENWEYYLEMQIRDSQLTYGYTHLKIRNKTTGVILETGTGDPEQNIEIGWTLYGTTSGNAAIYVDTSKPYLIAEITNQTDTNGKNKIIPIATLNGGRYYQCKSTYSQPFSFRDFIEGIFRNNAPTVTLPEVQTKTITITNNHYHNTITTTERERLVIKSTEPSTADSLEQRIQDYLQQVIRGAGALQTIVEDIPIDWDDIPETEDAYEEDPGDQPAGDIDPGDLIGLLDGSAFASIWHYVLELLALGADGIDAIKAVFDGLPYAVKLPYYASLAVMLIFGVLLRILI